MDALKILHELPSVIPVIVCKRPSFYVKTPYVADVAFNSKDSKVVVNHNNLTGTSGNKKNIEYPLTAMCHTPSLGCCGLIDAGSKIIASVVETKRKKQNTCQLKVYMAIMKEKGRKKKIIVGVDPKMAEHFVEVSLKRNLLSSLQNVQYYRRETKMFVKSYVDSRFDFTGIDENGIPFIMEVKNVPLADYEDITAKERLKLSHDFSTREQNSKVAYFPDGYRKESKNVVSPRALKHIRELIWLKQNTNHRCIMCYVIQRTDVNRFQISVIDPEYRKMVRQAIDVGVEIIVMVVKWNKNGIAEFIRDDLPCVWDG
jgi:DNA-binding sugar fermentation-stimulating protein